jgi:ABC-type lipoprotein export system ATPase subunit
VPAIDVVIESPLRESFRTRQVQGMFDLEPEKSQRSKFCAEIPSVSEDWNIGVIVGPSGSGKTTIARRAFGENFDKISPWPSDQSILDAFPADMSTRDIIDLLSSVGFSSPPAWLRPFAALSNGQQFRANLARLLAESTDCAVMDEFTSVVDRTVARISSAAVARCVRKRNRKFVAITCHYDVLKWLQPDWIVEMPTGNLSRRRLRRPTIRLQIVRCHSSAWELFKGHHYLSASLHRSAQCFAALIDGNPAAFVAVLAFPHPQSPGWREHRCVCLPDFQGVGIGHALAEFVASLYAARKPYTSATSHPAMIGHRSRSPLWRMIRAPSHVSRAGRIHATGFDANRSRGRLTASFRYMGPTRPGDARHFGVAQPRNQLWLS